MSEIPVVIKAVDQLTGPVKQMSAGAVTSLNAIKPAGVKSFDAVANSADTSARAIKNIGENARSSSKGIVDANRKVAESVRATTSAADGMAFAFKAAFGLTVINAIRRVTTEISKVAIETAVTTEKLDGLYKHAQEAQESWAKSLFGNDTGAGQRMTSVVDSIDRSIQNLTASQNKQSVWNRYWNGVVEESVSIFQVWAKEIEWVTTAVRFYSEAVDKAAGVTGKVAQAVKNPNEFKSDRKFGGMLPESDLMAIHDADVEQARKAMEGLHQAYMAGHNMLMPVINDITSAGRRMWQAMAGKQVPDTGEPQLWSDKDFSAEKTTGFGMKETGNIADQLELNFQANVQYRELDKQNLTEWADFQEQQMIRVREAHFATFESFGALVGSMLEQRRIDMASILQWGAATVAGHFRNAAAGAAAKAMEFKSYSAQYLALAAATSGTPTSILAARQAAGYAAAAAVAIKDSLKFGALSAIATVAGSIGGGALQGAAGRGGSSGISGVGGGISSYRGGATGPISAHYGPAAQQRNTGVTIQIMGNVIGQREYIDRLADQIAKRVGDGARIGVMA